MNIDPLNFRFWILDFGFWILDFGFWISLSQSPTQAWVDKSKTCTELVVGAASRREVSSIQKILLRY